MIPTRHNGFRVGDTLRLREFAKNTRTKWAASTHKIPIGIVVKVVKITYREANSNTDGITFAYNGETHQNVDELWFDLVLKYSKGICGRCEGEESLPEDYLCESCRNRLTNLT